MFIISYQYYGYSKGFKNHKVYASLQKGNGEQQILELWGIDTTNDNEETAPVIIIDENAGQNEEDIEV